MATAVKPTRAKRTVAPLPTSAIGGLHVVDVRMIDPSPFQPRRDFAKLTLQELADDIVRNGLLQPIVVRRVGERLELIAGERRWRATKLAGRDQIHAIVREGVTDEQAATLALVENLKRRDLSPLEEARAFHRLTEAGWSQERIAEAMGVPRSSVGDRLRLLTIGPWVGLLEKGDITVSQAVTLAKWAQLPEAAHARVIKALRKAWPAGDKIERPGFTRLSVSDFARYVESEVRAACYPLEDFERDHDLPKVDVAKHDKQCHCGPLVLPSKYQKDRKVRFCCDPTWWEPRVQAARDRARDEQRTAAKTSGRPYIDVPKGTPGAKADPGGPTGWDRKKYIRLTTRYGIWDLRSPNGLQADPADLAASAYDGGTQGVLAVYRGYGDLPEVLTTDRAAVDRARTAWAARWQARRAELVAEFRATLLTGLDAHLVGGVGARRVLATLASAGRAGSVLACAEAAVGTALAGAGDLDAAEVARLAEQLSASERTAHDWDRGTLVQDWALNVSVEAAGLVLSLASAQRGHCLNVPDWRIGREQDDELRRLEAETPNPWLRLPDGSPAPAQATDGESRHVQADLIDDIERDGQPDPADEDETGGYGLDENDAAEEGDDA